MKRILSLMFLAFFAAAAFAVPSVDAVQAEVKAGNYAQAESMMKEVVADKPGSAKAHYIYAEVLAHNGRFDQAADQAREASKIDPDIRFTQPEKFRAFQQLLEREQNAAKAPAGSKLDGLGPNAVQRNNATAVERSASSGVPGWVWGAGFAVIAVLLWRMFASRRQAVAPAAGWQGGGAMPMGGNNYGGGPMGGPVGGPMMGGGAGSGMLGTGIAAAGGFAAGMLADRLFEGNRSHDGGSSLSGNGDGPVPGAFDERGSSNPAADQLEERPVDFGSGGNDWDSGGSSSSDDSFSSGGGGGSDDGW